MAYIVHSKKFGTQKAFIECPNCHSKETNASTNARLFAATGGLLCATIIGIIFGVFSLIIALFFVVIERNVKIKCENCGRSFKVSKKEFKDYSQKLNHSEQIHINS